ncbi:APC family permease [Intestinibacter bartlettii]|uniref:Amino acid permease n=1 Tax=Intestinibacter bartlettii TaxID=261299 RepID=A0ABS8CVT1_9FIRM|nr:amino acid permease [Intestinibacter bartlettii]SCI42341.1 Serine/threonine exchanger SteT [uncultured Clostridium sp.]MCB5396192.1 amino acid permease [Intestinibacter bartlettii]MCB5402741.1 amino acid permease [Intestinibacter bartlettii]MCB5444997.1 amino acid permease [Intestinibacter bartlettii]MCB5719452.1 amino acid permease [Intestinibacter bartlettii]
MENKQLQKNLGIAAALSTVVGMVIGGGVFFKPQAVYTLTGGAPGLGILAWIIAGIMTITAGLTAAEVSAAIPKTGGMMVYIEEIYGKKLGFLTGWMQTVLFFPATAAAIAVMFGQQAAILLNNPSLVMPMSIGVILLVGILNTFGSKTSGTIQTVSTVCKLIPLVLIIVFGFIKGSGDNPVMSPLVAEGISPMGIIGQLLVAILFAYDGWINVGAIAGEMKNPGKDLPKAIIGGLSIVMAINVVINLAYLWVLPASELAQYASPASIVAEKIFGPVGGKLINVGILVSVFGCLNGYLLTGPRIPYTLANQKVLPAMFGKLNKHGVPANATLFMAVLSAIYALSGQFNLLSDLSMFAIWAFYTLTFIGVIKLRKTQPDLKRPYKVPFYPVIPIISICSGLFVVIDQLFLAGMKSSMISLGGVIITLIGLPVYSFMTKNKPELQEENKAA